jgi:hypothetical protein
VEYFRPLGTRTQLNFVDHALVSRHGDLDGLSMLTQAELQHLVGERWLWEAGAYHFRQYVQDQRRVWSYGGRGSVAYFLEDFCSIDLGAEYRVRHFSNYGFSSRNTLEKALVASLGITVGRGRLDAPGLITPQRAMN